MKKAATAVIAAIALSAVSAGAVSYQDIDEYFDYMEDGDLITGWFDIVIGDGDSITISGEYLDEGTTYDDVAGFAPGLDLVESAELSFYFRDDYLPADGGYEEVKIRLEGPDILSPEFDFGFEIFGGSASVEFLVDLNADGRAQYKVKAKEDDFYFDYARLTIQSVAGGNSGPGGGGNQNVPDNGWTAGMLLGSMVSISLFGKKRTRRS